jgi:cysteine desulfurase
MRVYFDNAATTKVDPGIFEAMTPYFKSDFGNPSSVHYLGQAAKIALDQSRETVAHFFGVRTSEVIFTSGATEAINMSHKGLVEAISKSGSTVNGQKVNLQNQLPEIITSSVEHKAVLETCEHLQKNNLAKITYLPRLPRRPGWFQLCMSTMRLGRSSQLKKLAKG